MMFLAIVCLFNRIKLAVKVIEAAADFVSDYKEIVLVPILLVVIAGLYCVYWIYGLAWIFSTGEVYHNSNYPWGKISWTDGLKNKVYLHVFTLFWHTAFLLATSHFIVACATSIWYFNRHDRN